MDKCIKPLLDVFLVLGMVAFTFAHESRAQEINKAREKIMSSRENNIEVMRKLFRAVEEHDDQSVAGLYQPDVEFHWPPSLPYGSSHRGLRASGPTWGETWALVQPTAAERKMDPRIVAASDDEVVALWHQRGLSPSGEGFDGEVLGLYRFRDGKLARAQMFYFDTTAVNNFLAKAITPELREKTEALFTLLKQLPEERQLLVRQAYWRLQAMTPDQRHLELRSGSPATTFSNEERELLERLLSLSAAYDK